MLMFWPVTTLKHLVSMSRTAPIFRLSFCFYLHTCTLLWLRLAGLFDIAVLAQLLEQVSPGDLLQHFKNNTNTVVLVVVYSFDSSKDPSAGTCVSASVFYIWLTTKVMYQHMFFSLFFSFFLVLGLSLSLSLCYMFYSTVISGCRMLFNFYMAIQKSKICVNADHTENSIKKKLLKKIIYVIMSTTNR